MAQTPANSNAASPTANHARASRAVSLSTAMRALEINHAAPTSEYQRLSFSGASTTPPGSSVTAVQAENAHLRAENARLRSENTFLTSHVSRQATLLKHANASPDLSRMQFGALRGLHDELTSGYRGAVKEAKEKGKEVDRFYVTCEKVHTEMCVWREVAENLMDKAHELAVVNKDLQR